MINLGLKRIARLIALSPNSSRKWKAIHIAGTNGKGSVAAYLAALFRHNAFVSTTTAINDAGDRPNQRKVKVGRFTSPHFIDRWDCIWIDGKAIEQKLFEEVEREVEGWAAKVQTELIQETRMTSASVKDADASAPKDPKHDVATTAAQSSSNSVSSNTATERDAKPTEFEILTTTAFEIFSRLNVDIAIIECGLGGRLDATNILTPSEVLVSVITQIGLDHQGLLGDTIEQIAREKAGIIKEGVPVVVDAANELNVKAVIKNEAQRRKGGEVVDSDIESHIVNELGGKDVTAPWDLASWEKANLCTALTAYDVLRRSSKVRDEDGLILKDWTDIEALRVALQEAGASYPGRLQWVEPEKITGLEDFKGTRTLIDGAHNVQAAAMLRDYVDKNRTSTTSDNGEIQRGKLQWILAFSEGKEVDKILETLIQSGDNIVFCRFGPVDGMPWVRPTPPETLVEAAKHVGGGQEVKRSAEHVYDALRLVVSNGQQSEDGAFVVVAGSLYLISDTLRLLRDDRDSFLESWKQR